MYPTVPLSPTCDRCMPQAELNISETMHMDGAAVGRQEVPPQVAEQQRISPHMCTAE